jgi:hypothetical protein
MDLLYYVALTILSKFYVSPTPRRIGRCFDAVHYRKDQTLAQSRIQALFRNPPNHEDSP